MTCECGCGLTLVPYADTRRTKRFIHGHNARVCTPPRRRKPFLKACDQCGIPFPARRGRGRFHTRGCFDTYRKDHPEESGAAKKKAWVCPPCPMP